jgi:hypothetical protein
MLWKRIGATGQILWSQLSLTGSDLADLETKSHASLDDLTADDHTQYLLAAGTRALTADWDAGAFEIRAQTFESDVATGTAPFVVASTTEVSNLNVAQLNGKTWAVPAAIGSTTPAAGTFTTLTANTDFVLSKTITAGGVTGNQTINKSSGTVNFAAAASSLTVTNSLVSANSIIIATIGTNDATMTSVQAVAGAGSFVIYANAAATAETRVNFIVTN